MMFITQIYASNRLETNGRFVRCLCVALVIEDKNCTSFKVYTG